MPISKDLSALRSPEDLDEMPYLPLRHRVSYVAMLVAQSLTSWTDNFVKMLIIAFAGAVAIESELGSSMQIYLGIIFSLPYILFSPMAGWLSDRFSKQRMMVWTLLLQTLAFLLFIVAAKLEDVQVKLLWFLVCFFVVATQSALFSPAKFGILKELIGSKRIGSGSGVMQMLNLTGTLAGMWAGPFWFGYLLHQGMSAEQALMQLLWVVTVVSLLPIGVSLLILRTPSHADVRFHWSIMWEHVAHLKLVFRDHWLRFAALCICFFWFTSNAVASILVQMSHELHPDNSAAAAKAMATMPALLGLGIMFGSLFAGYLCRKRIELGLVPISALLMTLSLIFVGGFTVESLMLYGALTMVGVAGGCFMTPLYAFIQDRAKTEERARVMASLNLMDCAAAIVANLCVVKPMMQLGWSAGLQIWVLALMVGMVSYWVLRHVPKELLHFIAASLVKWIYRVRVEGIENFPKKGAVLLLSNHVSYMDAILLGYASPRELRFVMTETLYANRWYTPWLQWFKVIPVSPERVRQTVKQVAEGLRNQEAIALFPEGQLTRTGLLNELQKGYELMLKLGGDAQVQPVWIQGMWGSGFSFAAGRFFKFSKFPYRMSLHFGQPLQAQEAHVNVLRYVLDDLSLRALIYEKRSDWNAHELNWYRLQQTAWLHSVRRIKVQLSESHVMYGFFAQYLPKRLPHYFNETLEEDVSTTLWIVEDKSQLRDAAEHQWLLCAAQNLEQQECSKFAMVFDAESSMLLTTSLPHYDDGVGIRQLGHNADSWGRCLPALTWQNEATDVRVKGTSLNLDISLLLKGGNVDQLGFLRPTNKLS